MAPPSRWSLFFGRHDEAYAVPFRTPSPHGSYEQSVFVRGLGARDNFRGSGLIPFPSTRNQPTTSIRARLGIVVGSPGSHRAVAYEI